MSGESWKIWCPDEGETEETDGVVWVARSVLVAVECWANAFDSIDEKGAPPNEPIVNGKDREVMARRLTHFTSSDEPELGRYRVQGGFRAEYMATAVDVTRGPS